MVFASFMIAWAAAQWPNLVSHILLLFFQTPRARPNFDPAIQPCIGDSRSRRSFPWKCRNSRARADKFDRFFCCCPHLIDENMIILAVLKSNLRIGVQVICLLWSVRKESRTRDVLVTCHLPSPANWAQTNRFPFFLFSFLGFHKYIHTPVHILHTNPLEENIQY